MPGGARLTATESWGGYDFTITNLSDTDRLARVLMYFAGRSDVQYGRDLWVPAHSTLSSWLLVGPAPSQPSANGREIKMLLFDRTGGKEKLILPGTEERERSRAVLYRQREPSTTVLLDEFEEEEQVPGRLPQLEPAPEEVVRLVRALRAARDLPPVVTSLHAGRLPVTSEAYQGIDHFVVATERLADNPVGLRALRQWLEQGGKVWVMLDRVDPEVIAPLLGDSLDFQLVDRVGLTSLTVVQHPSKQGVPEAPQQHERPVEFARVLLPAQERVRHTIDGWPVWFTRPVGKGKVVFSTLGPRGWVRGKSDKDHRFPPGQFPTEFVTTAPLDLMADQFQVAGPESAFRLESFQRSLTEEIGYSVIGRNTVALVFAGFLLAALVLGIFLGRRHRRELLGWLGPVAALGAAGTFYALGESSRRSAAPTVAVGQVAEAVSGTPEAAIRGLVAVYRPVEGAFELGAREGGLVELDFAGTQGRDRQLLLTDMDAWHWENLSLPAGRRLGTFRYTQPTAEPITAVARFGPRGVEGKLTAGPFTNLADLLLSTPGGRHLSIRLRQDGTFSAGARDILPPGQYLAGTLLSDWQQRRQELYREFLAPPKAGSQEPRTLVLAWADPIEMPFSLVPGAREVGSTLLVVPLQLERPAPGSQVTVPGPLISCRRLINGSLTRLPGDTRQPAELLLRFQLPPAVLPLEVESVRLLTRIDAPSRRITIAGLADGKPVEVHRVESPIDPIKVEIAPRELLRLDEQGGLLLNVTIGDLLKRPDGKRTTTAEEEIWRIRYIEIEVAGRTLPAE
jgi:hypothetical protein